MRQRPRKVRVSGRDYKVVGRRLTDAYGECNVETGEIVIDARRCKAHYMVQDTLLHETMHAVLRQQGRDWTEAEEAFVTVMATGLLGVLRDNPKLVEYLIQ